MIDFAGFQRKHQAGWEAACVGGGIENAREGERVSYQWSSRVCLPGRIERSTREVDEGEKEKPRTT